MMVLQPAPANPPLLAGAVDATTLLRAIVDRPEDVRKFLASWDEYLKRYEAMIEGYGGLVKVNQLIAEHERLVDLAAKSEAAAKAAVEQARAEAGKILQDGHADVDAARAGLAEKQAALKEKTAAEDKRLRGMESALKAQSLELEKKMQAADATLASAAAREAAVNAQLEKLRSAGIRVEL